MLYTSWSIAVDQLNWMTRFNSRRRRWTLNNKNKNKNNNKRAVNMSVKVKHERLVVADVKCALRRTYAVKEAPSRAQFNYVSKLNYCLFANDGSSKEFSFLYELKCGNYSWQLIPTSKIGYIMRIATLIWSIFHPTILENFGKHQKNASI